MFKKMHMGLLGIIILISLIALSIPVLANTKYINVDRVLSDINTGRAHPAGYLIDDSFNTYWGFKPGSKIATAELTLEKKAIIYGLEIDGFLADETELSIEYKRDAHWIPFFASSITDLPVNGVIDLSYDRIVSNQIRIVLRGKDLANSRLTEVKVIGEEVQNYFQLIKPVKITASDNTAPTSPAKFLDDGNTYTSWQTKPDRIKPQLKEIFEIVGSLNNRDSYKSNDNISGHNGEVVFTLDGKYKLENINIFFTEYTKGDIKLEVEDNGNWYVLDVIHESNIKKGWYRLDLSGRSVSTERIKMTVEGYGGELGGIGEVKFWGYGLYHGKEYKLIGLHKKEINKALNYKVELSTNELQVYNLELAIAGEVEETVSINLNGISITLQPSFNLNGNTVYKATISKDLFREGENFVTVQPLTDTQISLLNIRLSDKAYHVNHSNKKLNDKLLLTPSTKSLELELNLENKTLIERINIYSDGFNPYFNLYAMVDDDWIPLYSKGNERLSFYGPIKTSKIKIENPGGFELREVIVLGNLVTNSAPQVNILTPENNGVVELERVGEKYLIGFIDNQLARVLIEGKKAEQKGHYFWFKIPTLGLKPWEPNEIKALAVDSQGRENSDKIFIMYGERPLLNLYSEDKLYYTAENTFNISGEVKHHLCEVTVNNKPVVIQNFQFNTEVELHDGFNLIEVKCKFNPGKKKEFTKTLYRRVVHYKNEINITIDSPLPGSYLNKDQVVVAGTAEGLGEIKVNINGKPAIVDGIFFRSTPISLVEGENIINIEAFNSDSKKKKQITIIKDTIIPVIEKVTPEEGYLSSTSTLNVSGKVIDESPFWLYVNGNAVIVADEIFNTQVTLPDGKRQIEIVAVDAAGNISDYKRNVVVDTTPPLPFTVIAEPADWTNNTQPVISFAAEDETSGISHYELTINNGDPIVVTSPYKLSPQPDGVHDITVWAVDNAGWKRAAKTKIYIDTTPPEPPKNFRAVPGDDKALIRWKHSVEDDVVEYQLYREPAWESNKYLVIDAGDPRFVEEEEIEIIDDELSTGDEYSYYLKAIDHADNISESTEISSVNIGLSVKEVEPENEEDILVEYEGVNIKIPEKSISEEGSIEVTAVQEDTLPDTENIIISDTLNFTFKNKEGNVKEDFSFEKPVTVIMEYNSELIPEGYTPFDLYIYYYSEAEGRWIRLKRTEIDIVNNRVSAETDHFSAYNVQVKDNYSPAAEEYKDLGLSPYQSYYKENQEYISPASGSLTIKGIDFQLPGRNGLDLIIGRIHNTSTVTMEKMKKAFKQNAVIKGYSSFGEAWNINIPWIEVNDQGTFAHFEDGSTSKIEWKQYENGRKATGKKYVHEGRHFYAEKGQTKVDIFISIFGWDIGGDWRDDWYRIVTKDGKEYSFNKKGMVTEIVDRTGQNKIKFYYGSGRQINYIEDSLGRRISFSYNGGKITQINSGDRTYKYFYDGENLVKVVDPEGRVTEYIYTYVTAKSGSHASRKGEDCNSDSASNVKIADVPLVEKVIYPTGGVSKYQYNIYGFKRYGSDNKGKCDNKWSYYNKTTIVVESHYQALTDSSEKIKYTEYNYSFNLPFDKKLEDPKYIEDEAFRVTDSEKTNLKKKVKTIVNDDNQITKMTTWDLAGNELEKIKYIYDVNIKEVTTESVYKEGGESPVYSKYYDYDNWGNITYFEHTGTGLVEISYYYNTDSYQGEFSLPPFTQGSINNDIHNLLGGKKVINENSRDGVIIQESAYQYDKKGNLLEKAVYHQNQETGRGYWIETKYEYDDYGNIVKTIGPMGGVTKISYSSEYKYAYPTLIKKIGKDGYLTDADGNIIEDSIQKYGYDFDTGLKSWEIDPKGNLTEYEYDKLNRLVKIVYPDDGDLKNIINKDIEGLSPADYTERSDNPVKIQYYDDENSDGNGISTTVVNAEENIDIEQYKSHITNDKIEAPIFNKSRYFYDALNRWIKLEQVLVEGDGSTRSIVTGFEYDKSGNRTKTIDAEGKVTRKQYGPLNRVKKIIYPDESYSKISYDDSENSRTITDPEGNKTIEVKDWGGNVIEVSKFNNGEKYSSYAAYDAVGNKIYEIDGNNRRTDYYYDDLNRLTKKKLPAGEYVLPGYSNNTPDYRPVISYQYDDNGNKIAETTAIGNTGLVNPEKYTSSFVYDGLNRRIKIIDAQGNITKEYYNPAGEKIKTVDPLGNVNQLIYDSRGNKIAAIDGEGNVFYTEYDIIGKKTAQYDPRGVIPVDENPDGITGTSINLKGREYILAESYKTRFEYDSLGRLIKTTDPMGNTTETIYDDVGNKKKIISGAQSITNYYNDLYFLRKKVINEGTDNERISTFTYDKVGNILTETDPRGKTTEYKYDDLYRRIKVIKPDGTEIEYTYDRVGNKIKEIDGNGNITRYYYNPYDKIKEVYEAGISTPSRYYYDPEGKMVQKEMANGLVTEYNYNNLGQLVKETKPGKEVSTYSYDSAGNLKSSINPLGVKAVYQYNKNNQAVEIQYYRSDSNGGYSDNPEEIISYEYDRAGNRVYTEKSISTGIESSISQGYDPLNRIERETRNIEGKSYTTSYRYDRYGNLTGIKYPGSSGYIHYNYDNFNQLKSIENIAGDESNPAFDYYSNGSLEEISYDNGIKTNYTIDDNSRVERIKVLNTNTTESILDLNYAYDGAGNITRRNDNEYQYDSLNRLIKAEIDGTFFTERGDKVGYVREDYYGDKGIDVTVDDIENISLDYASGSVGIDFAYTINNISRIELKTIGEMEHRLTARTIDIYYSNDNENYTKLAKENWRYERDYKGDITLTIINPVTARYIKVHSKYDDRDEDFKIVNKGEFTNILKRLITVYQKAERSTINYEYDEVGNRTRKILKTGISNIRDYSYYPGTNRLMSDGKYGYVYDKAGNLVKKGNMYSISNDTVTFTATKGDGVEYYEYEYNLQNRLSKVKKNGEVVAEFLYDADGMRIKSEEKLASKQTTRKTYYVYGYNGKVLMEESSDTASPDISFTSYIFAFGKNFAKVDGIADPAIMTSSQISYFHYDNLGSTRLMTDSSGNKVMDQDYLPFGGDLPKVGQVEVYNEIAMEYKFTGQNEVVSIGLYYYGARYYDPAIGRFITEDTYMGEITNPQSQNLYVYVMNNPLRYVDPTGNVPTDDEYGIGNESDTTSSGSSSNESASSNSESKPKNNNTDIEAPNVEIPALNYSGPYNEEVREELAKFVHPDVIKQIDILSKTLSKEEFNHYINYVIDHPHIYVPDLANIDSSLYSDKPGELLPVKIGISGNFSIYEFGVNTNLSHHERDVTKSLNPISSISTGISIDFEVGSGDVETSIGLNKRLSVGILWEFKDDRSAKFSGIAVHLGVDVGSLPVNLKVNIPENAPPFPGL